MSNGDAPGGAAANGTVHLFGLDASPRVTSYLLLAVAVVILIIVLWMQRKPAVGVIKTIWKDYRSVVWCFIALSVGAFALGYYADAMSDQPGFWQTAAANVFASLLENLLFFSLLGFGLLLIQRREADRNRSLDDKIDLLFNAKNLRGGEVAFLREELRKISADCQRLSVDVDVIEHDRDQRLVQIDVARNWVVANYLSSEPAVYGWGLNLSADAAGGRSPSLTVYPSYSATLTRGPDGEWQNATDNEELHAGGDLSDGQTLVAEQRPLMINPGEAREFRTRFRGWQQLLKGEVVPSGGAVGPVKPERDFYKFWVTKHWDEVSVVVKNSLKSGLRVSICLSPESGAVRLVKKIELAPGDRLRQAHVFENLPANSRVYLSFEPL